MNYDVDEMTAEAVKRYARDLYIAAIIPKLAEAAEKKERIDKRYYEQLTFHCLEAAWRMVRADTDIEVPEGKLNVLWDKVISKVRG